MNRSMVFHYGVVPPPQPEQKSEQQRIAELLKTTFPEVDARARLTTLEQKVSVLTIAVETLLKEREERRKNHNYTRFRRRKR